MKIVALSLICLMSLATVACQRDNGVEAGGDYQPRPAPPATDALTSDLVADTEVRGEMVRINTVDKTILLRLDNGMEQTVAYDDATTVSGSVEPAKTGQTPAQAQMVQMKSVKPGTVVVIRYAGDADNKMAKSINVTEDKPKAKAPVRKK